MGETAEASAAGADASGYDYKRLHSYPLIRVRNINFCPKSPNRF